MFAGRIVSHHTRLAVHDAIPAEGLQVESLLMNGNRAVLAGAVLTIYAFGAGRGGSNARAPRAVVYLSKPTLPADKGSDVRHTMTRADIGEQERPLAAHAFCVPVHHLQTGADHGREVDLVDHQQV